MITEIEREKTKVRQILLPSVLGWWVLLTVTALAAILLNKGPLVEELAKLGISFPESINVGSSLANLINEFLNVALGREGTATLVTTVLWSIIGILVYVSVMIIKDGLADFGAIVAESNYVFPDKKAHRRSIFAHLSTGLIRIASFFSFVLYIPIFITVLLPLATSLMVNDPDGVFKKIINLMLGSILLIISLHFFTVLLRLISQRTRLFDNI